MEYINLEYYPIDDLKGTGRSVANSPDVSSPGLKVSAVSSPELKVQRMC